MDAKDPTTLMVQYRWIKAKIANETRHKWVGAAKSMEDDGKSRGGLVGAGGKAMSNLRRCVVAAGARLEAARNPRAKGAPKVLRAEAVGVGTG
jgi:hypothetical protein